MCVIVQKGNYRKVASLRNVRMQFAINLFSIYFRNHLRCKKVFFMFRSFCRFSKCQKGDLEAQNSTLIYQNASFCQKELHLTDKKERKLTTKEYVRG